MRCQYVHVLLFSTYAVVNITVAEVRSLVGGSDAPTPFANGAMIVRSDSSGWRVLPCPATPYPGIEWRPAAPWNLAAHSAVVARVVNASSEPIRITIRLDDPTTLRTSPKLQRHMTVPACTTSELVVIFTSLPYDTEHPTQLIGMRGWPGQCPIDRSATTRCLIFGESRTTAVFEVLDVVALGSLRLISTNRLMPFVDRFGQFMHADWPGKIHHESELRHHLARERDELAQSVPPLDRDEWGAWLHGPRLATSDFFRVERHIDRWWFVAPSGRLFWSFGVNCVRAEAPTPISEREAYFAELPASNSGFGRFYGRSDWAPQGWYTNRSYQWYDFAAANLLRKYGESWSNDWIDHSLERLSKWGWNTIGNWSHVSVGRRQRMPYTYNATFGSLSIEGSKGYWGKFPDPFAEQFSDGIRRAMAKALNDGAVGDPWCFGFFVHNELAWGHAAELGAAALRSPITQPARTAAVARLRARYDDDVTRLNTAWGTAFQDWAQVVPPEPLSPVIRSDLEDLTAMIAEQYFRLIAAEIRRVAPGQLYLGCRFAWVNDIAIRAAAQYCDVITFNRYTWNLDEFRLPQGLHRPVLIGEFHFGALDRGLFHPGLRAAHNQDDRAEKFTEYVRSALRHPCIVGVHWFQYRDQPVTGRGDGENYQIGLVDICDTPYPEMVRAAREVGAALYRYRATLRSTAPSPL